MHIAYIGNRKNKASDGKSFNTESHLLKTLQKLGHTVTFLQEDELQPDWVLTLGTPPYAPDMVLYTRTWGQYVKMSDIERLRELGIPTASYHLDLYVGLSRKYLHAGQSLEEILQTDPFWRTDFVFTPDGDPKSQEIFKANGVNHIYIKPGVFEDECNIYPISAQQFRPEVLFVGGGDKHGSPHIYGHPEWNYRNELIQWLYDTYGSRFLKKGHPQETVRGRDLNNLYSAAQVTVGDSVCVGFDHQYYWSDRVYETIGRGGFLIHPYIKGLEEEFTDGETIVFYEYGNFAQLKEKIDYYLEYDDEREAIRLAGQKFVKENCTYTQRMAQMLDIVRPSKSGPGQTFIPDDPTKATLHGFPGIPDGTEVNLIDPIDGVGAVPTPSLAPSVGSNIPLKISLGAGLEVESEEGVTWINVDIVELDGINLVHNLAHYPWPFEDGTADFIKAKDIIEHMPSHLPDGRNSVIAFIEECYRILKPGGALWIQTPGWDAEFMWIDPTHVRGFDQRSFDFFDPETDFGRSTGFYSPAKFRVRAEKLENRNLQFTLEKL